jgi:hypothetical protein
MTEHAGLAPVGHLGAMAEHAGLAPDLAPVRGVVSSTVWVAGGGCVARAGCWGRGKRGSRQALNGHAAVADADGPRINHQPGLEVACPGPGQGQQALVLQPSGTGEGCTLASNGISWLQEDVVDTSTLEKQPQSVWGVTDVHQDPALQGSQVGWGEDNWQKCT